MQNVSILRALSLAGLLLTVTALQFSTAFAQGSLTPPGAPAPTFKTLSQVEPRYPISTFQTNLTVPGSYYLTTNLFSGPNLNDGINIRTNISNITIDLNGFSIIATNPPSGGPSPVGIRITEATNIVIRNGQIVGFDRGIRVEGGRGVVVENIYVHDCTRAGIECDGYVADPTTTTIVVRNCVVEGIDGTGEGANVSCDGIVILSSSGVVDNCVVRDITAVGSGSSTCINAFSPTNTFINNNYLSGADVGIKFSGGGTRAYYRNNLTAGVGTPSSGTGGVDRGGNF